ncbi:hypothetical protein BCF46_3877 [Litoreibacter meonggei]|uniref:Beta-barrel porin 2 n=1 Tax=Litoreibacter meonggei TaxID=1049199 RepID=A0A497V1W5_9RHOB|nr:hypothetical protein [Litoreibacter meonggei]RLJ36187.1 hypothetical protein BCF46_3877 [Litoreibacter meonggei]
MTIKRKSAANGVKQALLASVLIAVPLALPSGLSWAAEGLSGQFTLGQKLQHTNKTGVTSRQDEGAISRTDLGVSLTSETRSQTLSFRADTGLSYNFSDVGIMDRFQIEDPRVELAYKLQSRNSELTFDADYRRADLDETAFIDNGLIVQEIVTGTGRRETYALRSGLTVGREGPTKLELNLLYGETNYSGTTDPGLVDTTTQQIDGRLTFQISPVASVNVFASHKELDAETVGSNDRTTDRVGIGGSYDITPTLTATAEVSHDKIETDNNAGTITTTDGIGYSFGLSRTLPNGELTFDFSEEETVNGKRRQATVGRQTTFKRGTMAYSLGVTKTDGLSAQPLANLNVNYELDKLSSLKLTVSQASSVNDDDETTINSRLGLTYARELSALSSLTAGLQVTDRNTLTAGGEDQTSVRLNLSHRYEVGGDWELVSGYTYTKTKRDTQADRKTSTLFVGLERAFDFRP